MIFDILIGILIAFSTILGFFRGMIHEILGIFVYCLTIFSGYFFADYTSPYILKYIPHEQAASYISLSLILLVSFFTLNFIKGLITKSIKYTSLKNIDRPLGGAIGIIKGLCISSVLYMISGYMPKNLQADISAPLLHQISEYGINRLSFLQNQEIIKTLKQKHKDFQDHPTSSEIFKDLIQIKTKKKNDPRYEESKKDLEVKKEENKKDSESKKGKDKKALNSNSNESKKEPDSKKAEKEKPKKEETKIVNGNKKGKPTPKKNRTEIRGLR